MHNSLLCTIPATLPRSTSVSRQSVECRSCRQLNSSSNNNLVILECSNLPNSSNLNNYSSNSFNRCNLLPCSRSTNNLWWCHSSSTKASNNITSNLPLCSSNSSIIRPYNSPPWCHRISSTRCNNLSNSSTRFHHHSNNNLCSNTPSSHHSWCNRYPINQCRPSSNRSHHKLRLTKVKSLILFWEYLLLHTTSPQHLFSLLRVHLLAQVSL